MWFIMLVLFVITKNTAWMLKNVCIQCPSPTLISVYTFFFPLWFAHSHTHTHTHTHISNPCTLQNMLYFLCVFVSVGSLAGGIQSCQRWSRCCSISSHQSSPTLLPTSSTSASETTRSSLRYWSPRRSRIRREGLETRRVLKTLLEGALTYTHTHTRILWLSFS